MRRTLLIVDDLSADRLILNNILCRDYEILEADSGEAALAMLAGSTVCAVLLDISMPKMDGYEVLCRIRQNPDLLQLPVIMLTAHEDDAARKKALSAGANDFIMKPYHSDVIRHCLETNIALSESAALIQSYRRDKLTGLYRSEAFFAIAAERTASHAPGYYIMSCFNIERFKIINDQFGREMGDAVLRHVATVLQNGFTPLDGICCRIASDNFAVLYPSACQESDALAEIRAQASHMEGLSAAIRFYIGRYTVDDLTLSPSAMFDRANIAADSVKGRYDNKIAQYDESMRQQLLREQRIVLEMEPALAAGQFEVWFQPQYNHATDAMIGSEALVRWRHPERGLIPPNEFIPIFERNGFIYALDRFVWEEVCHDLRRWLDEGRNPLPVSVNISRYDIFCPDLIEVILQIVKKYDISIELLRLEVTESAFSESAQHIIDVIKSLIALGFTVEIDDFGSGYSSLNTLKDVPAQILKLDMKFLAHTSDSQRGGNIVESVVRMAKWLGMSVIAEGVETLKQANYLRSIGCSYMQGFLFARPMPAERYAAHCAGTEKEERLLSLETVENLNNNSFWDPDSMDTLIFNSYVGSACIFEYHNGRIELLRATQKYAQIIGSAGMSVEDALKLDWSEHLDESCRAKIAADLARSIESRDEVSGEYVYLDLPGCPHETHLRSTLRVIASSGSRYLVYCTNENITAQRQAEQREHQVAEEMRLIMANVNSGICATVHTPGNGFRVIFANDRFYSMFGYVRGQMEKELGSIVNAVHPDDMKRIMSLVDRLIVEGGQATYEYRCIRADGTEITVSCANTLATFPGVKEPVLLAVINDVTERVAAERRARSLGEQMQIIMKSVNGGISAMVIEEGGRPRIVFANEKYYSLLGYSRESAAAEPLDIRDVVYSKDRELAQASVEQLLRDGIPNETEYRCIRRDGSIIHVHSCKSLVSVEGYGDKVIISFLTDITATVASEQRERAAAARLQSIMDNVDVGIVASVFEHDKLRFVFSNDRYFEMRGYTRAQFAAEVYDPHSVVVQAERSRVKGKTMELAQTGDSVVMEYEIVRRDGVHRHVRNSISIGSLEGVRSPVQLSIFRDITEEKAAALREKQASEQAQSIMSDIDSGLTATIFVDGHIQTIFSNDQFYLMRGYTRAQYRAEVTDFFACIHPDDRERIRQNTADLYTAASPIRDEYRVRLRDGTERWVRRNMTLTHFTGVTQPVVLSVYSDVTAELTAAQATRNAMAQMQNMMDDMPGGFVRLRLLPDGNHKPDYINEGFCRLLMMSREETMARLASDPFSLLHPDDLSAVRSAIVGLKDGRSSVQLRNRLLCGSGAYLWMNMVCRITEDAAGGVYLNSYYSDASEQMRDTERQKALLDHLPGGAGIYELIDGALHLIYQNKSYWELVGLNPELYSDPTPMSAIHPGDLPVIQRELSLAISQRRDMSCDIQLKHLTQGYRPVHLAGRVIPGAPGRYVIYASFTPIAVEGQTYQQMLPLLLSAMMESTTDLSFAKDTSLRYLSASHAFAHMVGVDGEEDILGKTDHELFRADFAEKYRRDDLELLASGKAMVDIVEAIPSEDGVPRYSSTSKYLLRDGLGKVVGIYGVGRDITHSVELETRLHLVADSIPGGLASYTCTPGDFSPEHIHLVYFNDGFCRLFGYTREEYEPRAAVDPVGMVYEEDRPILAAQWANLMENNTPINCLYRAHIQSGGYRWISLKAVAASRVEDTVLINAILQNVTDQRELIEQLRISEEENRLALVLGDNVIARFLIADRTLILAPEIAKAYQLPEKICGIPAEPIRLGMVAPESEDAYTGFFASILQGRKASTAVFRQRYLGEWHWLEAKSTTVFSSDGKPVKAVISFTDVTERLEKETIYIKWQQSMAERPLETYTLFRCNLNHDSDYASAEGSLLTFDFDRAGNSFNERAKAYILHSVHEEDRKKYAAFVNSDTMLAEYYRGHRSDALEYRELLPDGGFRWLRLSVDLVEYPNSTDVEAYLMYENINKAKTAELQTKERSETDPLTGLLNRTTFIKKVTSIIRASKPDACHAMLMLDIDSFKQVNDVFGHATGDRTLIEVAKQLRSVVRRDDLLARIGGDEFLVFLRDILGEGSAATKAKQICAAVQRPFSMEVQISGSVGISMVPRDGTDFDTLYRKADCALYYVKGSGKDGFVQYRDDMADQHLKPEENTSEASPAVRKRRIVIVEDNPTVQAQLQNIFREEFIVEQAKDGAGALIRLRHYGSAISVVLLDLMMPGMDGFAVLEQMKRDAELRSIPVIIVSGDERRETCLQAIRKGAADFVTKPVDPEILRVRLHAAINNAENERLRTENRLLEVQKEERCRFESAIDSVGLAFIYCDWLTGKFTYHPSVSRCLLGTYDCRPLWQILLSDLVADTQSVQRMQQLVHHIAFDRTRYGGSLEVRLMTPHKVKHRFRMIVRKQANEFELTNQLIITLNDMEYSDWPE